MSGKRLVVILALIFAVVLAVIVARRMSTEVMAVVIGIVCGVASGIPTSVLLLVAMNRGDRRQEHARQRMEESSYNSLPVVVIQGGAPQALAPGTQAGYWPAPPPGPTTNRQFHIVGGNELAAGEGYYR